MSELGVYRDEGTYGIILSEAMRDIFKERMAQDAKWGVQNHHPMEWLTILMEEVGEFSRAILINRWGAAEGPPNPTKMREELVQVAAVALAMLECCDRNHWTDELVQYDYARQWHVELHLEDRGV
jgi:NTP pyrophosphatase (non-canonical NTP hydrolase)